MSTARAIALFLLLLAFALAGICWLTSCEVIKSKSSRSADSTAVNRLDSGSVKRNESSEKTQQDWWRETLLFRPQPVQVNGDTNIINNYYTQPEKIIREGGKQSTEKASTQLDSSWKNAVDSLRYQLDKSQKNKRTEVLSVWQIIALCAGTTLGVLLFFYLFSKFKITRR